MIPVMRLETKVRLLAALTLSLFIISIFVPFLQATWRGIGIPEIRPGPQTFWSFKGTIEYWYLDHGRVVNEFWFSDYWFLHWITETQHCGNG